MHIDRKGVSSGASLAAARQWLVDRSSSAATPCPCCQHHVRLFKAEEAEESDGLVSEQEKSYFAGYTDAEGCISISKIRKDSNPAWTACVVFNQVCPVVIERMQSIYGGTLNVRKPSGPGRLQKSWRVASYDEVRRFLADITPHLREKRDQASAVLWEFDPKQGAANDILCDRLKKLKTARIDVTTTVIESRLAIASHDPNRKCLDCDLGASSRNYCAKHYQRALRNGHFVPRSRYEGIPFTRGRELTPLEAPYFAGYFDGDGCLKLSSRGSRWFPQIAFAQTQPHAVRELHAIYGGSLSLATKTNPCHKPCMVYQLGQRDAVIAMLRDVQHFVIEKRDQVKLLLEEYRPDMSFADGGLLKKHLSSMKTKVFVHG